MKTLTVWLCREGYRLLTTGGHYAYLKIAEGCDKHCTYCIIPKVRGDYRSVPMEDLIVEAEKLAAGGVKELILVAQETTLYGTRPVRQKVAAYSDSEAVSDPGDPLDPCAVLLSGGDLWRS